MKRRGVAWTIEQNERAPFWLGVYRFEASENRWYLLPIPFNVPARAFYLLWLWMRMPFRENRLEQRWHAIDQQNNRLNEWERLILLRQQR